MLYLVVHHPDDKSGLWKNDWLDKERVKTIPTTPEIGSLCHAAARSGDRVRFHRCGFGAAAPIICSEARVASVQVVDKTMSIVHFDEHEVLRLTPPETPAQGTSFYRA